MRLIKCVVAVAGDRVELRDGRLSIDGMPLADAGGGDAERFGARVAKLDLADGGGPDIPGAVVPAGHVLVLGDHRCDSVDGRWFGFVEADAIYALLAPQRGAGLAAPVAQSAQAVVQAASA